MVTKHRKCFLVSLNMIPKFDQFCTVKLSVTMAKSLLISAKLPCHHLQKHKQRFVDLNIKPSKALPKGLDQLNPVGTKYKPFITRGKFYS